jgi:hypothetical protein
MNEKNITLSPGVLKLQEGGLFVADFSNNTEYKYTLPHARIQVLRPGFFTLEVSKNSFYIRSISALLQVKLTDSK